MLRPAPLAASPGLRGRIGSRRGSPVRWRNNADPTASYLLTTALIALLVGSPAI